LYRVHVLQVEYRARLFAVQAHRHQLLFHAVAGQVRHARAVMVELRRLPGFGHAHRLAAAHGHHVDAALARPQAAGQATAAAAAVDHVPAIRRKARMVVEAGLLGQLAALGGAAGAAHVDRAQARFGPGRVQQLAAVGAEAGLVFVDIAVAGHAHRRAARQRLAPQLAQRVEDQAAAIGRGGHVADHARVEAAFGQGLREAQRLGHHLLHLGGERDLRCRAAGHVHAPETALRPDHHRLRVRRPVEAAVGPEDRPGLLLVMAQAVPDRAHLAAGDVHAVQHAGVAHALDEGQGLSVRRHLRAHRAAGRGDHGFGLAGLAVEALDGIDHAVRVAVVVEGAAGAHVLREVDVAAVGRNRRLADVLLLVGLLHQLDAAAGAGGVVQPELARAQRARGGEVLAGDDVLPVRRPGRVVEQAEVLFGHLARITAVGGDGPDVVAAAAVGGEGDAAAVRRPARLH